VQTTFTRFHFSVTAVWFSLSLVNILLQERGVLKGHMNKLSIAQDVFHMYNNIQHPE
jgi:hypothetical protein